MTRKFFTIFLLLSFLLPGLLLAQSHILKADGSMEKITQKRGEAIQIAPRPLLPYNINQSKSKDPNQILATVDTLTYRDFGVWNTDFGEFGQDVMIQWFVAPADMEILSVAVNCTDDQWDQIEVKLVHSNWTKAQLDEVAGVTARFGHYEATGNGFLDSNPFEGDETTTGAWVSNYTGTAGYEAWGSPFAADLWSDDGFGAPMTVIDNGEYEWTSMSALGIPTVTDGTVFGVAMKNTSSQVDQAATPPTRVGFLSSAGRGVGAWKYYANGRSIYGSEGDWGWWHRTYTWDVLVEVNMTSDRAPVIHEITILTTTLTTDARTVDLVATDDNPAGGTEGIASANLFYSVDGGDFAEVAMTGTEPNYTADIPGQISLSEITYYVEVTDVEGNSNRTPDIFYFIFGKTQDVLFLYNVNDFAEGTARHYYMGTRADHPVGHDYWSTASFGTEILADILAMYDNVIQVDGSFPSFDLSDDIDTWIKTGTSGTPKRYFLSSQDYGCVLDDDCADVTFQAGDFQYDFLGLSGVTNQDFPVASLRGDPWLITPVADDPVSGFIAAYNADSSVSHYYDPAYETGLTNYMDNIDVLEGGNAVVTFTALDSAGVQQTVGVRNDGDGFYTAYITFDYFSTNWRGNLDSTQSGDPDYAWGVAVFSQAAEFLEWGGYSAIETDPEISPRAFRLAQNYPNPFNPTTTIEYSIPNKAKVTLKIFDIRGREVATLVDNNKLAGKHKVNFDASIFASGVYFYQLTTSDNQTLVKKMMFIK